MCGIGTNQNETYCSEDSKRVGQLMHHFVNLIPDYESIATSTQLGPNIFWSLTALQYVSTTGNRDWLLNTALPFIDLSTDYILQQIDPTYGMLKVAGPLWIDVLVRENYTSDSNAAVVYLLDKLAGMYDYVHDNNPLNKRSVELRTIRTGVIEAMNKYLWNYTSDDHFITQLNPDGSTRDFVDYDSNLLAVAFGAVPFNNNNNNNSDNDRVTKILKRVDSGNYTHVRGTWCCEVPYSGDAEDCYIVGGDVCGDSIVTLGRIGWADSHARKRVGDVDTFINKLLTPLQQDLLTDTWLYERYDENGTQIRTAYYFEYPAFVSIMLREIMYGIELDVNTVTINPFPAILDDESYFYNFGTTEVYYNKTKITMRIPGDNESSLFKIFNIHGLNANSKYLISQVYIVSTTANAKKSFVLRSNLDRTTATDDTDKDIPSAVSYIVTTDNNGLLSFNMNGISYSNLITITQHES